MSENVDSTPVAMATKSENASISNTFGPDTRPILYESIFNVCDIQVSGSYNVVVAQFSVTPLIVHNIYFIADFNGLFPEKSRNNGRNMGILKN